MKRSRRITLTLIASISLAACDSDQAQMTQQALYQSQQECIEDWGGDECFDDDHDGHWHGPHYFYSGGRYHYYSKKAGGSLLPVAATSKMSGLAAGATPPRAIATTHGSISRGGFGGLAASRGASS